MVANVHVHVNGETVVVTEQNEDAEGIFDAMNSIFRNLGCERVGTETGTAGTEYVTYKDASGNGIEIEKF